jgi:hypothetical protein
MLAGRPDRTVNSCLVAKGRLILGRTYAGHRSNLRHRHDLVRNAGTIVVKQKRVELLEDKKSFTLNALEGAAPAAREADLPQAPPCRCNNPACTRVLRRYDPRSALWESRTLRRESGRRNSGLRTPVGATRLSVIAGRADAAYETEYASSSRRPLMPAVPQ